MNTHQRGSENRKIPLRLELLHRSRRSSASMSRFPRKPNNDSSMYHNEFTNVRLQAPCRAQRSNVACNHLGFAALSHSDDDISLFAACFDTAVGFGKLFQRIASINDRSDHSRLAQLFQEHERLPLVVKSSLVLSMTLSAPGVFTHSTFVALQTPVTSAPKCLASCTAYVPILPEAPMIRTFCSF